MRLPRKKVLAAALALSVVAVVMTALPAFAAADTVSGFTPICGVIGTSVTITGTGFTTGAVATAVTFPGAVNQAVVPASDNQITTTVPGGSNGTAQLIVVDADGNGTSAAAFQVITPTVAPSITSFAPLTGAAGSAVVIVGGGFCGTTSVLFNATPAVFTVNSNNQITATVPVGATTGPIHVTTGAGTIASATSFTPVPPTTVTSFSPTSGAIGATVVITGTGFTTVTAVRFNGVAAVAPVTNSTTQITATVPVGATTGPISVTAAGGTGTSLTSFTVTPTTITSFSPTSGPPGTSVVIHGTGFTGVTAVRFNGVAALSPVTNSATQITATVPSGATTGPISVTAAGGTGTSLTSFTVTIPSHGRSISSFKFTGNTASGHVKVGDGFSACNSFVPVYIQQQTNGGWKLLDTTATNGAGDFKTWVPSKSGTFRAQVKKLNLLAGNTCGGDTSKTVHHS